MISTAIYPLAKNLMNDATLWTAVGETEGRVFVGVDPAHPPKLEDGAFIIVYVDGQTKGIDQAEDQLKMVVEMWFTADSDYTDVETATGDEPPVFHVQNTTLACSDALSIIHDIIYATFPDTNGCYVSSTSDHIIDNISPQAIVAVEVTLTAVKDFAYFSPNTVFSGVEL